MVTSLFCHWLAACLLYLQFRSQTYLILPCIASALMAYVRTADALLTRLTSTSLHCAAFSRLSWVVTSSDSTKFSKCIASFPLLAACASDKIPEIPQMPPIGDIPALNALGEPTFASLGLNSYWPSGWYQAVLEFLHVNLDLPWWAAIATSMHLLMECLVYFKHESVC